MSHLPWSIHLITKAPELDVMRILIAVGFSQIAVVGAFFEITVFQNIFGVLRSAGSEVDSHHDIAAGFFGPVSKFVQAKLVCLNDTPGKLRFRRPLVLRTYTVLPVITGDKISTRITDDRYLKLSDEGQRILAQALLIGKCASLLIDSFINSTSQVFDKGTKDSFVNFSGQKVFVNDNLCFFHILKFSFQIMFSYDFDFNRREKKT